MRRIEFYLVRHGESEGNREGLFRGRTDFPLTDRGREQARSLAKALEEVKFDIIISSPLKRAYETALYIAKNPEKIRLMEEFNNIYLAEWEGQKKEDIKQKYPKEWALWITEPEKLKLPNAETIDEVRERAVRGITKLIEEFREQEAKICIVTHRAVLKPLVAGLLGVSAPYFWKFHFDTASYSVLEWSELRGFTLFKLNETNHLKEFIIERV